MSEILDNPDAWLARIRLLAEQLQSSANELLEIVQVEANKQDQRKGE